jgi:hypothetical protein
MTKGAPKKDWRDTPDRVKLAPGVVSRSHGHGSFQYLKNRPSALNHPDGRSLAGKVDGGGCRTGSGRCVALSVATLRDPRKGASNQIRDIS